MGVSLRNPSPRGSHGPPWSDCLMVRTLGTVQDSYSIRTASRKGASQPSCVIFCVVPRSNQKLDARFSRRSETATLPILLDDGWGATGRELGSRLRAANHNRAGQGGIALLTPASPGAPRSLDHSLQPPTWFGSFVALAVQPLLAKARLQGTLPQDWQEDATAPRSQAIVGAKRLSKPA
jgi:hypothetical protein